jgi:HK97 family phage prohead protease
MNTQHKTGGLATIDFPFEVKSVAASGGTFSGYASVFGNVDLGGDVVAKGAFVDYLDQLKSSGRKVPILWQHRSGEPIGVYDELKEDDHGLFVEGRLLVDDVQRAREAYALLKAKAITGMSIGYKTRDSAYDQVTGIRTLKKLDLPEASLVTFPMNEAATVTTVKSAAVQTLLKSGRLPTLAEFEEVLREVGFSHSQAKTVAGHGLRKLLSESRDAASDELLGLLSRFKV